MIFDQTTGTLYDDEGKYIRTVHCPLALRPDDLKRTETSDRICSACSKTIRCIDEMTDDDLRSASREDISLCVFATEQAKHIVFLQPWGIKDPNWEGLQVVQTLRSLEAMQAAHQSGFELLIKEVGPSFTFGDSKFIVYRHTKEGRLWWSGDYRAPTPDFSESGTDPSDWQLVYDWFWARRDCPFPLAAYAIPKDLRAGVRVYLPDVIEELPHEEWNQGNAVRILAMSAIWTGVDFRLEPPMDAGIVG